MEGELVNPVPRHRAYGGDSDDPIIDGSQDAASTEGLGNMMSFSIDVGLQYA